jgi:hypothetical protein
VAGGGRAGEAAHRARAAEGRAEAPFTRTLEDGTTVDLRGGYYPVIYDSDFSAPGGARRRRGDRSVQLFDPTTTGRDAAGLPAEAHRELRAAGPALDRQPAAQDQRAAKDIAMREALLSVHSR